MKYVFFAKSSGNEPYQVIFSFTDQTLAVTCNCKAGIFGKLCKHKMGLLTGDINMLANSDDLGLLNEALTHLPATSFPELLKRASEDEFQVDVAKKALKKSKKALEEAMRNGV